jgi:hypothetical protein
MGLLGLGLVHWYDLKASLQSDLLFILLALIIHIITPWFVCLISGAGRRAHPLLFTFMTELPE